MAQLYLLHEICTNKTAFINGNLRYSGFSYSAAKHRKKGRKKQHHQNNVIQILMHTDIQWIQFFLWPLMRYTNNSQCCFCSIFWLLYNRPNVVVCLVCLVFSSAPSFALFLSLSLARLNSRYSAKKKKLISMTYISGLNKIPSHIVPLAAAAALLP